jgi:sugar phosphate isomerase/epimerase
MLRRTPLKPGKGLKRKTALKKVSPKRKQVQELDRELWARVWADRKHVCEECGVGLGNEPLPHFFSHILTKQAHPKLRHVDEVIQLLCYEHHAQWEFGKRSEMRTYKLNQERIQDLLELERNG